MSNDAPILSARNVSKTYRTGSVDVAALRAIDLDINAGDFVTVMGPSGNGKTTLLNCLSGLDDIDDGTVLIDGADIHRLSDAKRTRHRAERMGFIFQSFNLIPVLSARENVEIPLGIIGRSSRKARAAAADMLERVGLSSRIDHLPTQLSGGEQQRVAIARALVTQPAIIWADEPTGNLDSETAEGVIALLKAVNESGQTVVMVTHDRTLGAMGNRLVQVRDGRVTYSDNPTELLETVR